MARVVADERLFKLMLAHDDLEQQVRRLEAERAWLFALLLAARAPYEPPDAAYPLFCIRCGWQGTLTCRLGRWPPCPACGGRLAQD